MEATNYHKKEVGNKVNKSKECAELHAPELSDKWKCILFGGTEPNGILWISLAGKEPNWFWHWMQYICFGNKWKRMDK